jgi:serine protease Do
MGMESIRKRRWIGASGVLLVGLAFAGPACWAVQFRPLPVLAQAGELGLPNAPMGYLGIITQEITADKAKELKLRAVRGVFVSDFAGDSPAAKAGMKKGDVVTEYDGQVVEGMLQLGRLVRETPPGRTVKVSVWRDGRSQNLNVLLSAAPQPPGGGRRGFPPQRPPQPQNPQN